MNSQKLHSHLMPAVMHYVGCNFLQIKFDSRVFQVLIEECTESGFKYYGYNESGMYTSAKAINLFRNEKDMPESEIVFTGEITAATAQDLRTTMELVYRDNLHSPAVPFHQINKCLTKCGIPPLVSSFVNKHEMKYHRRFQLILDQISKGLPFKQNTINLNTNIHDSSLGVASITTLAQRLTAAKSHRDLYYLNIDLSHMDIDSECISILLQMLISENCPYRLKITGLENVLHVLKFYLYIHKNTVSLPDDVLKIILQYSTLLNQVNITHNHSFHIFSKIRTNNPEAIFSLISSRQDFLVVDSLAKLISDMFYDAELSKLIFTDACDILKNIYLKLDKHEGNILSQSVSDNQVAELIGERNGAQITGMIKIYHESVSKKNQPGNSNIFSKKPVAQIYEHCLKKTLPQRKQAITQLIQDFIAKKIKKTVTAYKLPLQYQSSPHHSHQANKR